MLLVISSLVLHCLSLLRTMFASLTRAHELVRVQNVNDYPKTKLELDSEINVPFCSWMSNIHELSRDSNGTRSLDSD